MRKLLVLVVTLALALALTTSTTPVALAGGKVVATWTLSVLGQGDWGGGPLFADGSAGGMLARSAQDGHEIALLEPTSWSWVVPGVAVDLCFAVQPLRPAAEPYSFCFSDVGIALPVTGTPIRLDVGPYPDLIVRVTLAN